MNNCEITSYEISRRLNIVLEQRNLSIRDCCEEFNKMIDYSINKSANQLLDKSFVQRVKDNKFKVISNRVIALCKFFGISLQSEQKNLYPLFHPEFTALEDAVKRNPEITKKAKALLSNIIEIINSKGNRNEVY